MSMITVYIYRANNAWAITDSKQGLTTYETMEITPELYDRFEEDIQAYRSLQHVLGTIVDAKASKRTSNG